MKSLASIVGLALAAAGPALSQPRSAGDPTALPPGPASVVASADECTVWRRERSFSRSVEAHDAASFAAHLHAGAIFNAGTADAERGRGAILESWAGIVEGKTLVLRWRPGVVNIGGEPSIAVSRGPYILQTTREGVPAFSVGLYQTVWSRAAADSSWRVLFDGGASTPKPVADRAEAEQWVAAQPMANCPAQ